MATQKPEAFNTNQLGTPEITSLTNEYKTIWNENTPDVPSD